MLALKCVVGESEGVHFRLTVGINVIGRSEEADIRLRDEGVSRNHVEVVVKPQGEVMVNDLGSTNGTFVDQTRIDSAALAVGGTVAVGSDVVLQLVSEFRKSQPSVFGALTKREREVALLVAQAKSNEEVATELGVKRRTVETHLERIYSKTGIKSRVELSTLVLRDLG